MLHKKAAPGRTLPSSKVASGLSVLGQLPDYDPGQDHHREKRCRQDLEKPVQYVGHWFTSSGTLCRMRCPKICTVGVCYVVSFEILAALSAISLVPWLLLDLQVFRRLLRNLFRRDRPAPLENVNPPPCGEGYMGHFLFFSSASSASSSSISICWFCLMVFTDFINQISRASSNPATIHWAISIPKISMQNAPFRLFSSILS